MRKIFLPWYFTIKHKTMELKFYLVLATGLIPLLVGMIWYSKALFANAWMQASGMTEEKGKSMNMIVIFILVYVFGIMLSMALMPIVIHQMGVFSVFADDKTPEGQAYLKHFLILMVPDTAPLNMVYFMGCFLLFSLHYLSLR